MNLIFNKDSRRKYVKSILFDIKSNILAQTKNFDIIIEPMDYLRTGWGFSMEITAAGNTCNDRSVIKQELIEIRNFISNMTDYLFNGDITAGSSYDGEKISYEIVSAF